MQMRKGIILAGGKGSRLGDLTKAVSKQLLPVYDKPMVYYPVSTLMQAGVREILIISTPDDLPAYRKLLGNGSQWGVRFKYAVQPKPKGLAEAFIIGEKFIGKDPVCLALGDNIFHGRQFQHIITEAASKPDAVVLGCHVKNPSEFGVAEIDDKGRVLSLVEKPKKPKSDLAVVGLYFYPNDVVNVAKHIKPSKRGELEITSVNEWYRKKRRLALVTLPKGVSWLDTGNPETLHKAACYAYKASQWQPEAIANLDVLAKKLGFVSIGSNVLKPKHRALGMYANDWLKLLDETRVTVSGQRDRHALKDETDTVEIRQDRSNFERDYERVVFSAPLRRLAGKTQVRAFPDVDYIHNRLTHSLEVSAVAQSLARNVGQVLVQNGDIKASDIGKLCWIAQAAGLAHDLGNPPYGHAGENAIQYWAASVLSDKTRCYQKQDAVWKDFLSFDGNAQTFRMLASDETRMSELYKFTAASLGAVVKYPTDSAHPIVKNGHSKFNVFSSEKKIYLKCRKSIGLDPRFPSDYRHPLSYLSEAADDICYRVLDFEDAVVAGVIDKRQVIDVFRSGLGLYAEVNSRAGASIQELRARLIHMLVCDFTKCFLDHYDEIMTGKMRTDLRDALPSDCRSRRFLDEISKLYTILFTERAKVVKECGAYSQIPRVLDRLYAVILEVFKVKGSKKELPEWDDISKLGQHIIVLAWGKGFYARHRNCSFSWWMHIMLDFVVGMTDNYINELAKRI